MQDNNCDLTRTLRANGAGGDVGGYEWTIKQNGTTDVYNTSVNLLQVTQQLPSEPIFVSIRVFCAGGITDPLSETFDFNIVDGNPLGDAGSLITFKACPYDEGDGSPYNCYMLNSGTGFIWHSTNEGSGNIVYSYVLTPSNMGDVTENESNDIIIMWPEEGNATLELIAINICTCVFRLI